MMDKPENDPDQKKIMRIYTAFGAGLILSLVPSVTAALVSSVLLLGVLVAAYIQRGGAAAGSLSENHMSFIIRTIWIGSFVALLTVAAAAIYLFQALNNMPLDPCRNEILSMTAPDMALFESIMGKCWPAYWAANFKVFIIGGLIAAGPVLLYFTVRYIRGFTRARGGYRIAKPKAWF